VLFQVPMYYRAAVVSPRSSGHNNYAVENSAELTKVVEQGGKILLKVVFFQEKGTKVMLETAIAAQFI
jgi:hypothetical protein